MIRTAEHLEAWVAACVARETTLGFDEWIAEQNPNVVDPVDAEVLNDNIRAANDEFRNHMRPLAVKVLGDWAVDDATANRSARGWSARISRDGKTVTLVDTLYATGHNETTTRKEYRVDFTGRVLK